MRTIKERFDSFWIPEPNSGCWLWVGGGDKYGTFSVHYKTRHAHRVAWELYRGEIPDGMCVCHSCDTPLCVNPAHLFLGTTEANQQDSKSKDRNSRGERHGNSKLTSEQVEAIRSSSDTSKSLAKQFGVSSKYISDIKNSRSWKHVCSGNSGVGSCANFLPASEWPSMEEQMSYWNSDAFLVGHNGEQPLSEIDRI